MLRFLLFILYLILTSSCISIGLEKDEIQHANNVKYKSPANYIEFDAKHLDAAWKNPRNGNSISFLSDCHPQSDPNLEALFKSITYGIDEQKMHSKKFIQYNERRALYAKTSGYVDGVLTHYDLVLFKKNECIFILTYVGLTTNYEFDLKVFKDFLKGFKVP